QLQYADQSGFPASCATVELRDGAISCPGGRHCPLAFCALAPGFQIIEQSEQRQRPKQAAPFQTVERVVQWSMPSTDLCFPDLFPDNNPVEKHSLSSIYWW